jgi:C1A family cysteine protease
MIYQTGAILSKKDIRDYIAVCAAPASFPEEFELNMVRVKSQGSVSSCVAFALSEVIEYFNSIQHGSTTEMSTGYIYGNRSTSTWKNEGMIVRDALKAVQLSGDVVKSDFPYNIEVPEALERYEKVSKELHDKGYPYRISTYAKLTSTNAIKQALMSNGPVIMAMEWFKDMKVKNGILTTERKDSSGGHCMVIYGWNEVGWKVRNSWGRNWGDKGNVVIPYDVPFKEVWGIRDATADSALVVKKPFSTKFGSQIAKVLNRVVLFIYDLFHKTQD